MLRLKIDTNTTYIRIKYKISYGEKISERELEHMIKHNIRGLCRAEFDGKKTIQYTAPFAVSLEKYLKNRILEEAEFWRIVLQIAEIVERVEKNGLYQDNLLLDCSAIFVNEATKELYFIYRPLISSHVSSNAAALIGDITHMEIKKCAGVQRNYLMQFQFFLNQDGGYRLEQMKNYCIQASSELFKTAALPEDEKTEIMTSVMSGHISDTGQSLNKDATVYLGENDTVVLGEPEEGTAVLASQKNLVLIRSSNGVRTGVSQTGAQPEIFHLGKDPGNDYCITGNQAVSREHAVILVREQEYYLSDKNSTNGTFVNGRRLEKNEEVPLQDKDEILLANEVFMVEIK